MTQNEPALSQRAEVGSGDDFLSYGALLGIVPFVWAHGRTGFTSWDLNASGSVTISDITLYAGRFLSAAWSWVRAAMPGPFEFMEMPPYQEPTILTSLVGGGLLFLAAFATAFIGVIVIAIAWLGLGLLGKLAAKK